MIIELISHTVHTYQVSYQQYVGVAKTKPEFYQMSSASFWFYSAVLKMCILVKMISVYPLK